MQRVELFQIENQCEKEYKWSLNYAQRVGKEYARFLSLRAQNSQLSPSDDVDRMWHQHILNTQHYADYCNKIAGKFVHHDPTQANDQNLRKVRLANTILSYHQKYGKDSEDAEIWNTSRKESTTCPTAARSLSHIYAPRNSISLLVASKKAEMSPPTLAAKDITATVKIAKTFQIKEKDDYRHILRDKNDISSLKIKLRKDTNVEALTRFVANAAKHNAIAVRIFRGINLEKVQVGESLRGEGLQHADKLVDGEVLVAECYEMTSHGFC